MNSIQNRTLVWTAGVTPIDTIKNSIFKTNRGKIIVNEFLEVNNWPGVFAIGDVAGEPMLAHKASAQGEMVAEIIAGKNRDFDKVAIPAIVFTEPEIVSVGLSPDEARDLGESWDCDCLFMRLAELEAWDV